MVFTTFSRHLLEIRVSFLGSCPGGVSGRLPGCFLEAFGHPLGHLGTPLGTLWDTLGLPWAPFGPLLGHLGVTLAPLWRPWGAFGCLWRSILREFNTFFTL